MTVNTLKTLFVGFFATTLVSCTISSPVVTGGTYDGLTNSDPNMGRIFVYRQKAFAGSVNQYDVMVDGVLAGSLPNGSFFSLDIEPGEHKIQPRTLTSFRFGKGSTITVEQGKSYCLELTLNFCVQCKSADINLVDNKKCESEINSLTRVHLK